MNRKRILFVVVTCCVLLALAGSPGYAQEVWKFHLVPYLWAAGLNGDVGVKGIEAPVEASFGDIWDALDMAFLLHAEANRGKWTLMLDPTYLKLSKDANAGPADISVELQNWIVDFGLFYRPYEKALGDIDDRTLALELLAGGRYMSLDQTLGISGLGDAQDNKQWADPILGGRLMADVTENLAFMLRGDVGGFGVGSDLTWSVSSFLGYQFTPLFSLWGGYRALGVDYQTG
ncbi:MAG: hypothetical protein GY801_16245, partial [bacterium]|nr:hypothetical protein [bacterium]